MSTKDECVVLFGGCYLLLTETPSTKSNYQAASNLDKHLRSFNGDDRMIPNVEHDDIITTSKTSMIWHSDAKIDQQ